MPEQLHVEFGKRHRMRQTAQFERRHPFAHVALGHGADQVAVRQDMSQRSERIDVCLGIFAGNLHKLHHAQRTEKSPDFLGE